MALKHPATFEKAVALAARVAIAAGPVEGNVLTSLEFIAVVAGAAVAVVAARGAHNAAQAHALVAMIAYCARVAVVAKAVGSG